MQSIQAVPSKFYEVIPPNKRLDEHLQLDMHSNNCFDSLNKWNILLLFFYLIIGKLFSNLNNTQERPAIPV